uniref:DUF4371 domain-containing protein n=1 Tax=Ditylenchus dipsaci TaxID=166011 RepID=A0A915E7W2_9BILA
MFVMGNGILRCVFLGLCELNGSHTGTAIRREVNKMLAEYGLSMKDVFKVITDGASNMANVLGCLLCKGSKKICAYTLFHKVTYVQPMENTCHSTKSQFRHAREYHSVSDGSHNLTSPEQLVKTPTKKIDRLDHIQNTSFLRYLIPRTARTHSIVTAMGGQEAILVVSEDIRSQDISSSS